MFSNVGKNCFKLWRVLCAVCTAHNTHPDDGPGGPKHVGAIMRYFNCIF
jgi:hypothetical protein